MYALSPPQLNCSTNLATTRLEQDKDKLELEGRGEGEGKECGLALGAQLSLAGCRGRGGWGGGGGASHSRGRDGKGKVQGIKAEVPLPSFYRTPSLFFPFQIHATATRRAVL